MSALNHAIHILAQRGIRVTPADIPGLYWVEGYPEMTSGQVIHLATTPEDGGA